MEVKNLTHGSLFSGIGGFNLGAEKVGIKTIWDCEILPYPRAILKQHFPNSIQYTDIKQLINPEYVDIISGGFPCQDISIAKVTGEGTINGTAKGIDGEKSGLWSEMYRICRTVRPKYIVIENSAMLAVRGFERVLLDLSEIGYDAEWQCLSGTTFGIQQGRERLYCIAYPNTIRLQRGIQKTVFRECFSSKQLPRIHPGWKGRWDIPEPRTYGSTNELPNLVDRIKAVGNAVQPIVAEYLFDCIKQHYSDIIF